jgi:hypothetical protein
LVSFTSFGFEHGGVGVCLVEEADSVWNWFGMGGTVHVHLCEGRDRSNVGKCSVEDV